MRRCLTSLLVVAMMAIGLSLAGRQPHADESTGHSSPQNHGEDSHRLPQRSLELQFTVQEGEGHSFSVLCAGDHYRASVSVGNADGETDVEVEGELVPAGEDQWMITFQATIHRADLANGGELTFSADGNTLIGLDQQARLATFPGPSLSVTLAPANH